MEFPASAPPSLLQSYLIGKSVRRALVDKRNGEYDFAVHVPHIVPHGTRDKGNFLWCNITERTLPRDADVVRKHVGGRRFLAGMKKVEEREVEKERIRASRKVKDEKRRAWNEQNGRDGKGKKVREKKEVDEDEVMASAMEVEGEEEEDEDAFWTRGKVGPGRRRQKGEEEGAKEGEGEDEDDEWAELPGKADDSGPVKKEEGAEKAKAKGKKKGQDVGGKRKRGKDGKVVKKARRPSARVRQSATA